MTISPRRIRPLNEALTIHDYKRASVLIERRYEKKTNALRNVDIPSLAVNGIDLHPVRHRYLQHVYDSEKEKLSRTLFLVTRRDLYENWWDTWYVLKAKVECGATDPK